MNELIYKTKDHPEANGRKPEIDDEAYTLWFPLENGDKLTIQMGKEGIAHLRNVILSQQIDDEFVKIEGVDPQRKLDLWLLIETVHDQGCIRLKNNEEGIPRSISFTPEGDFVEVSTDAGTGDYPLEDVASVVMIG